METSTKQAVNSTGKKGKGLILGPNTRINRLSLCICPSFPQADAHLVKSQLVAGEDSLGFLEQTQMKSPGASSLLICHDSHPSNSCMFPLPLENLAL